MTMKYLPFTIKEWDVIEKLLSGEPLPGSPGQNRMMCADMARRLRMNLQFPVADIPQEDFTPPQDAPEVNPGDLEWCQKKW